MSTDLSSSPEFQAALELVFNGREEPNGYTETAYILGDSGCRLMAAAQGPKPEAKP